MRTLVISVLCCFAAACGGKDDSSGGGGSASPATGPNPREAVLEAWKQGGLQPSAMTAATVPIGKDCQSGTVNNVDVVVCQYATAEEAKAGEKAGLEWVGATTGAAWASGLVVIGAADRRNADPSGRTINKLMKLAPK
jgi:hypothetical protein